MHYRFEWNENKKDFDSEIKDMKNDLSFIFKNLMENKIKNSGAATPE